MPMFWGQTKASPGRREEDATKNGGCARRAVFGVHWRASFLGVKREDGQVEPEGGTMQLVVK